MSKNFGQLQTTWNNFGEVEPFWSVLTNPEYGYNNINEDLIKNFYDTGIGTVDFMETILQENGYTFNNKIVLDFGCGVGRLTKACLNLASECYGMDISENHLNVARKNVPEAQYFLVEDYNQLPKLPNNPDIIISIMVLQHVRPDLIEHYINLLLKTLNVNGVALLHIPYHINHYNNVHDQINVMEMHFVPKKHILKIVGNNKCKVLGIQELDFCGGGIKNCIYVIKKLEV
jgi:ubiquinone/menaquinone biosynthesis C-methylase UbiE